MRKQDNMPARNKKNFRPTKSGAGMTQAGVKAYRRKNPGSKLKTAVTGKVKPGSKAANRRKSYCARSAGQMKKFPKAAADPNSRLRLPLIVGGPDQNIDEALKPSGSVSLYGYPSQWL